MRIWEQGPRSGHPGPIAIGTPGDRCFPLVGSNALVQMHGPAAFVAIDGHGDLGVARRMIGGLSQDQELGAELGELQDLAIHEQVHANVRGMAREWGLRGFHE